MTEYHKRSTFNISTRVTHAEAKALDEIVSVTPWNRATFIRVAIRYAMAHPQKVRAWVESEDGKVITQ